MEYVRIYVSTYMHVYCSVTYERIVCCAYKVMYGMCGVNLSTRTHAGRVCAICRYVAVCAKPGSRTHTYVSIVCQCSSSCVAISCDLNRGQYCGQ
jgi:hypothetical protein